MRVGQDTADLLDAEATTLGDDDPELAAKSAQCIDTRGTSALPQRASAMQPLQGLLLDRLDLHRDDVGAARRFEQCAGIGGIGLVALDVGAHIRRRKQLDRDAERVQPACPMMGTAAGFHDDQVDLPVDEPTLELGAGEAMRLHNLPRTVGDGQLENALGEIDADNGGVVGGCSSSIHVGLPLVER